MRVREPIQIIIDNAFITCIVQGTDEEGIARDGQTELSQTAAHFGMVGHLCEGPRIGPATSSRTGATVVDRFMRVVQAG